MAKKAFDSTETVDCQNYEKASYYVLYDILQLWSIKIDNPSMNMSLFICYSNKWKSSLMSAIFKKALVAFDIN